MKLTLPISDIITEHNYKLVPGIKAYELKYIRPFPLDLITGSFPVIWHGDLPIMFELFPSLFSAWAKSFGILCDIFSCTLGPSSSSFNKVDYYYNIIGKPFNQVDYYNIIEKPFKKDKLKKAIAKKISYMKDKYDGIIALENTNRYPFPAYDYVCDPEFISEVIIENDVKFVFDIAHALITSHNERISIYDYIERLPMERCIEVHISGNIFDSDILKDDHGVPSGIDYKVLDYVSGKVSNFFLVVEYYKDFDKLCEIYSYINRNYKYYINKEDEK